MEKKDQLRNITSFLLETQNSVYLLQPEVIKITGILAESQAVWSLQQKNIEFGKSQTPNGVAISPAMAAMCADDFLRTLIFIRGLHAAILDVRERFPGRPARILYAGCGPYATLAIPLMAIFSPSEATFSLLDLHSESIESAKSIINRLGLAGSVASFEMIDAGSYHINPEQPPDIILLEIMQSCLDAEPQVAVTRHLLKQAPHAILVPEEIRIELMMIDFSREFNLNNREENQTPPPQRDRIPVATIFVVNRETVNSWDRNDSDRLPAAAVRIPDHLEKRYVPAFFTIIRTYKHHILRDYDSGLSRPKLSFPEEAIKRGNMIQFHYELGCKPGLKATVNA